MNDAIVTNGEHSGLSVDFNDSGDYMDFTVDVGSPTQRGIVYGWTEDGAGANTALGELSLSTTTTGTNNLGLGYNALASSASASNQIVLGNSSVTVIRAQVTSITSLSDQRDKRFIEDIPVGLAFVNSLRPVKFEWNTRDGAKVGVPDMGFIAQDLAASEDANGNHDWLQLTYRDNPEKLEASYGRLVPVLVKAIQELAERVADLESDLFFATNFFEIFVSDRNRLLERLYF
jgi:hypothetical protein